MSAAGKVLRAARLQAVRDLEYTPQAMALLGGRIWTEVSVDGEDVPCRLSPHPDSRFVLVHVDGGGEYAVDDASCNCKAARHKDCRHRRAVREAGGVASVLRAFEEYRRRYDASASPR